VPRGLFGAGFVDHVGVGLFVAFSAVYFTRVVGLSAASVGLGLGIAGLVALGTAVPLGRLGDRWGVRRTLVALHVARALGTAAYAAVGQWWGFLAAVTVVTVSDQAVSALTQAFVAELVDEAARVRTLATYRTVANVGISVGAPLGGIAVGLDDDIVFRLVPAANAAAFLAVALLLARLTVPAPAGEAGCVERPAGRAALRDGRVWQLACVDTVLQLWLPVLNLGIPLWATARGGLSAGWLGALYALNTVMGVLLQVPASRLATTVRAARRCRFAAGPLLAAACLVLWSASAGHAAIAFCVGMTLLTLGELAAVCAAWTLSYAIAPPERAAEYLAAFGMGRAVGRHVLGPVLVTGLLQALGGRVWGVLAALFVTASIAGALTPPTARRPIVPDQPQ